MTLDTITKSGISPDMELAVVATGEKPFFCTADTVPDRYKKCLVTYLHVHKGWATVKIRCP